MGTIEDTNWAYSQVIELSRQVTLPIDPETFFNPGGLQNQLMKIRSKLTLSTKKDSPYQSYQKVAKFVKEKKDLFPEQSQSAGVVAGTVGLAVQGASALGAVVGVVGTFLTGNLEGSPEYMARESLMRLGVTQPTLQSIDTIARRLPDFFLKLLQFYRDHPEFTPPGRLQKLFLFDNEKKTWSLNKKGNLLIGVLVHNLDPCKALLQGTLLCTLDSLQETLCNPSELDKSLFEGNRKQRAKALTNFVLRKTTNAVPNGLMPVIWLIKGMISEKIESVFASIEEPTPEKPAPQSPASAEEPPCVPSEVFLGLFTEFQDLADGLGETLLDAVPEFSLLRKARKKDQASPDSTPVPLVEEKAGEKDQTPLDSTPVTFVEALGDVFACIIEKTLKPDAEASRLLEEQKRILMTTCDLPKEAVDYPGECIKAIFDFVTKALAEPAQCRQTALQGLIKEGEPPVLTEQGRALRALLASDNVNYLRQSLELNVLRILNRVIKEVENEQDSSKGEFLIEKLHTVVDSICEAIRKAGTAEEKEWDMSENAATIVQKLLTTFLPDISPVQRTCLAGVTRLGMGYFEKNFEKIFSKLICSILARGAPPSPPPEKEGQPPSAKAAEPSPPGILESLENHVPTECTYHREQELREGIASLFPGMRIVGKSIAKTASKFFRFGFVPFKYIVSAVFANRPPPERVAQFLLTVAQRPYQGPITVEDMTREKLAAIQERIEMDFKAVKFFKHPFRTISLAFDWLGAAIKVLFYPSVVSGVVGLPRQQHLIDFLQKVLKGGLHGGAKKPDSPPQK